ncbi:MAG: efflux RND transporter periplasmic adaptor subunit, partial [Bdellovibrionales bacterium]|nr:efflux RND transporter periplasmic adaptor subunit [Bdellovibrionales bacterium]
VSTAGPQEIDSTARVYGRLRANENKVAHVYPRFPGVIKEIRKDLGDKVASGELLAIVESNQSLRPYEIRSHVAGVVTKRHATLGEFVNDTRELFVVTDLSEVWADFQVNRDDVATIEAGHAISVDLGDGVEIPAKVAYVSPVTDEATQMLLVRAVIPNPTNRLQPGLFVTGVLSKTEAEVPLAVTRDAVQTFRDWNVVYLTDGHVFQAMPVELGRRDSRHVEVLAGLLPGDRYVSQNSFIVKADIEKAGASHDH